MPQRPPRLLLAALAAACTIPSCTPTPTPAPVRDASSLDAELERLGLAGAIVIETLDGSGRWTGHTGGPGLDAPSVPASTFKILNTLIALETGVARPDTPFPWDGVERFVPAWNQDLTLREAFRVSAVPVYQEIARRIGHDRMAHWVRAAGYGNAAIGDETGIDRFWLDGPLAVTPEQQIDFLRRLLTDDHPFSNETIAALREIMVVESTDAWTLRAKTGWDDQGARGWYVGFLERGPDAAETWLFALRIDMPDAGLAPRRHELAMACLRRVGAVPPPR